jgi:amino acid adenylation domain-containing protein
MTGAAEAAGTTGAAEPAGAQAGEPLEYWRWRLAGAGPVELPADRVRQTAADARGQDEQLSVPASTDAAIRAYGAGRVAFFLAGLLAVVHRHTAERDLLVGLRQPDAALRVQLDPAGSFGTLHAKVQRAVEDAAVHSALPMTQVLRALEPGRDLIRSPLITVTFGYLGRDRAGTADGADWLRLDGGTDMSFAVTDSGLGPDAGSVLRLCYRVAAFRRVSAVRLLRHWLTMLGEAVRDPGRSVGTLAVETARPTSRRPWNLPVPEGHVPPRSAGRDESLAGRFRATAAAHGDCLAVSGPSGTWSYAQLDRITDALAAGLRLRLRAGDRLALLCEHDIGSVAGVWSAVKAGTGYVPLDPRDPDGRLTQLVANAAVNAIACDDKLAARAARIAPALPVIQLATAAPGPHGQPTPTAPAPDAPPPDALAYVLHTSGSTGRPKGVMQTQRNVLAHALTYAARLRIGPGDSVPLLARYTFDAAVMDLYGALLTGASLHLADPHGQEAGALWRSLAGMGAAIVHCTPTVFRHLAVGARAAPGVALDRVRAVVLGGEEATGGDLRDFARLFPAGCALVNGLGPTECTMALQYKAQASDRERPTLPVGYPVEGADAELFDEEGQPTEVFGELVVRSPHVAAGYWNQPELTVRAFGTSAGAAQCYRTGDLAYRLADGALVFRGRKDRQVKIRGHRVEPAEAETLLRAHPTVGQAAVVVDQRPGRAPRLIGYVTSPAPMPASPDELLGYLRRQLPDYLVPARLVVLDALPVGPTGKLDRARLPAPVDGPAPALDDAPHTPLERAIAAVWGELLGLETVGVRDSFISLGGDSMQVMTLLERLRDYGIVLSLWDFLASPTIEWVLKYQVAASDPVPGVGI